MANERLNPFDIDTAARNLNANPGGFGLPPMSQQDEQDLGDYIDQLEMPDEAPQEPQVAFPQEPGFFQSRIEENMLKGLDPAAGFGDMQMEANYMGPGNQDPVNRILNSIPNLGTDASLDKVVDMLMERRESQFQEELSKRLQEVDQSQPNEEEEEFTALQNLVRDEAASRLERKKKETEDRYGNFFDVDVYRNPNDRLGRLDQVVMRKKEPGELVPRSQGLIETDADNVQRFIAKYENDYIIDSIASLKIARMLNPKDGSAPFSEKEILDQLRPGDRRDFGRSESRRDDSTVRDKRLRKAGGLGIDNLADFAMKEGESKKEYRERVQTMNLPATFYETKEYKNKLLQAAKNRGIDVDDPTVRADLLDRSQQAKGLRAGLSVLDEKIRAERETDALLRREEKDTPQDRSSQQKRNYNISNLLRQRESYARRLETAENFEARFFQGMTNNKMKEVIRTMTVLGPLKAGELKEGELE